ncbi:hypothetical protein QE152_g244 [Popillia japonica]|uniref:Tyr recombinase domain-containing protein n=1 Tax=Popillia japonica TaxID=7064 RepID=A0AAW1NM71_POPJA
MGYTGACRRDELTNMSIHDLEFKSDIILVTVPKTKNNIVRVFAITDEIILVTVPKTKNNIVRVFAITDERWITLIKTYVALRPKNINHSRFFLTYSNGYCISCPIGINTIGKMPKFIADFLKLSNSELYTGLCFMPKFIADFLKLSNSELYTGLCFRRSSATHLADAGSDLLTIKRHGGWKSSAVAKGYIETSMKSKVAVAHNLSGPSTSGHSRVISSNDSQSQESTIRANNITQQNFVTKNLPGITIHAQDTCQNFVTKNLPGITIHAQDTCSVSVNVYNNSTVHNNNNVN